MIHAFVDVLVACALSPAMWTVAIMNLAIGFYIERNL